MICVEYELVVLTCLNKLLKQLNVILLDGQ